MNYNRTYGQIHNSYIRVSFTDLNGHHMSKLISKDQEKHLYENKCEVYCGIIGFGPRFEIYKHQKVIDFNFGNGYLVPDRSSLHHLEWLNKDPRGAHMTSVLCDLKWPNGEDMEEYPRTLCQRLLKMLKDEFGLKLYSSFEPEFMLLQADSVEAAFEDPDKYRDLKPVYSGSEMYKTSKMEKFEAFFIETERCMDYNDIHIQDLSAENGPGQVEMPLLPEYGLKAADDYFILKQSAKEIAKMHNMFATFMTKPLASSETSSGCHYNHSLWYEDNDRNAMFDENDEQNLSELCKNWIGGLIEHLPAMTAITSPTINCYRRLHKGLAPDLCNWNINDRFYTIRVKNADESRTYVENRTPSSATSPYLVMACTLAAGIDGLRRKLPAKNYMTKDKDSVKSLPNSLSEALDALEGDTVFNEILGKRFTDWYIKLKRNTDLKTLQNDVSANELSTSEIHEYLWLS